MEQCFLKFSITKKCFISVVTILSLTLLFVTFSPLGIMLIKQNKTKQTKAEKYILNFDQRT